MGDLSDPGKTDILLASCLESLGRVLPATGIHNLHSLKATPQRTAGDHSRLDTSKPIVTISMPESPDQFTLNVYDDRLTITRGSSSFADFYEWYRKFMPEAQTIEATIRRTIERSTSKQVNAVLTQHEFKMYFSDFMSIRRDQRTREARNVNVLENIIPYVPDVQGSIELSKQDFFRLDLTLSRLEEFCIKGSKKRRNCWYMLEAPFNERGRFLVLTAQMRNMSFHLLTESSDGGWPPMAPFDSDFGDDYFIALESFFKGRALEIFMNKLLGDWEFQTQRNL